MTRRMDGEAFCKTDRMFNTTYNFETKVPPYVGIMFEISSFTDIAITTFELDIRWDLKPTDLSVQVYTLEGQYADRFNTSTAWELIASSTIVQAPEGNSGIIPAIDFTSVSLNALQTRSFYITMTGPYIDHTVYGLQKTGDVHIKGDDFQLFVGSGFTAANFPGKIDKVLDPQFAGIVYYKKAYQCDDNTAQSTRITFQFLVQSEGVNDSFVLRYNAAINTAVDRIIETNSNLNSFRTDFGLHKSAGASTVKESFTGECPEDWSDCNSIILRSEIRLSHMNALESSKIKIEMYRSEITSTVIDSIGTALEDRRQIVNVGFESVSISCQVFIHGVPIGQIIDDVQIRYFEDTTQMFLDKFSDDMAIFRVDVIEHIEQRSRNLRYLASSESTGSVNFDLIVNGVHPVSMSISDFTKVINQAFQKHKDVYLSLLKNNGIRPGDISEGNRIEYFQGIESITSKVDVIESPQPSPDTKNNPMAKTLTVGLIIILCAIAATFYILRHIKQQRKKREDDEKYREQRREERRLRRLERSNPDLDSSNGSLDISAESRFKTSKNSTAISTRSSYDGSKKQTSQKLHRSDSASSISISLHSLEHNFSSAPVPRSQAQASESNHGVFSTLRDFFGIQKSNVIDLKVSDIRKSTCQSTTIRNSFIPLANTRTKEKNSWSNESANLRSKSLSPVSNVRRIVNASPSGTKYIKKLHHSFDLSNIDISNFDEKENRSIIQRNKGGNSKTSNACTEGNSNLMLPSQQRKEVFLKPEMKRVRSCDINIYEDINKADDVDAKALFHPRHAPHHPNSNVRPGIQQRQNSCASFDRLSPSQQFVTKSHDIVRQAPQDSSTSLGRHSQTQQIRQQESNESRGRDLHQQPRSTGSNIYDHVKPEAPTSQARTLQNSINSLDRHSPNSDGSTKQIDRLYQQKQRPQNTNSNDGMRKPTSSRSLSPIRSTERRCARPHPNAIRVPNPVSGTGFSRIFVPKNSGSNEFNHSQDMKQGGNERLHRSLDLTHINLSGIESENDCNSIPQSQPTKKILPHSIMRLSSAL